ncbi:MAG: MFS transporter [Caulobacterales bacterium]|nr:MFS transporter [Caulobacterales bacterium]
MAVTETGVFGEPPEGAPPPLTAVQRLRAILGGSAGNLVEWYDWSTYIFFTVYFASHFFPEGDQTAQLFKAAAVSAVGFLARPLGAWLMGVYADRAGRRAALTLSVSMMCLGSLVIALTPTYAQVGALAPAILLAARVLQGLSVGGEYGASATYLSEVAGRKRRGFWSSFQYVTLIAGSLTAQGMVVLLQQVMPEADLKAWGWRIPFFIGAVLAVVVFWIRTGIHESQGFENAKKEGENRGRTMLLFVKHPRETLMVMGLTAGGSLAYYVDTSYMQKFLINTSGFSKAVASQTMLLALFCFMLMQPAFGWLSDRIGRKPLLLFAFGGGMIATWPILSAIAGTSNIWVAFGLIMIALTFQSGYSSISGLFKAELFPAHIRALGVALPYALANSIFGGSAEPVALGFKKAGHESWFYLYVTVILAVGLLTVIFMPDTRKTSTITED